MCGGIGVLLGYVFCTTREGRVLRRGPYTKVSNGNKGPAGGGRTLASRRMTILLSAIGKLPPCLFVVLNLCSNLHQRRVLTLR